MRPAIYLTLHSFAFNGSILDLSSAKWPEGAVWFNKNIVRSIFSRCRGENRGKRDNFEFCSPRSEPLFFWFLDPEPSKKWKLYFQNFIFWKFSKFPVDWATQIQNRPIECKTVQGNNPHSPPRPSLSITGFIWGGLFEMCPEVGGNGCFHVPLFSEESQKHSE